MKPRVASRILAGLAAVLAAGLVAGCSEQPQVAVYEKGEYSGQADKPLWEGTAFNGDRTAYDKALNNRARLQNEYNRVE
jgi:hypothetical protein